MPLMDEIKFKPFPKRYLFLRKIVSAIPGNQALKETLAVIFNPYNKAVKPLLDIDVLNERIRSVKDLAESNEVSGKKFFIINRVTAKGTGRRPVKSWFTRARAYSCLRDGSIGWKTQAAYRLK